MTQLFAIALGGAVGSLLRFWISSGVYLWLGRGFPYGTLAVNVLGSFLIGLMTEALVLQRVALAAEYRAAILVGVFGGLTTFSTFSMESFALLQQGQISKAGLNILVSVSTCIFATWIGWLTGRGLFSVGEGHFWGLGWPFPYALTLVNALGAFLIGLVAGVVSNKLQLPIEQLTIALTVLVGMFVTLSSLYLILHVLEHQLTPNYFWSALLTVCTVNLLGCGLFMGIGVWLSNKF